MKVLSPSNASLIHVLAATWVAVVATTTSRTIASLVAVVVPVAVASVAVLAPVVLRVVDALVVSKTVMRRVPEWVAATSKTMAMRVFSNATTAAVVHQRTSARSAKAVSMIALPAPATKVSRLAATLVPASPHLPSLLEGVRFLFLVMRRSASTRLIAKLA